VPPGVIEVAGELIDLLPLRIDFLLTRLTGLLPLLSELAGLEVRRILRARRVSGVCFGLVADAGRGRG